MDLSPLALPFLSAIPPLPVIGQVKVDPVGESRHDAPASLADPASSDLLEAMWCVATDDRVFLTLAHRLMSVHATSMPAATDTRPELT